VSPPTGAEDEAADLRATVASSDNDDEETPEAKAYLRGKNDFDAGLTTQKSRYFPKEYAGHEDLISAYRKGVSNAAELEGMTR